MFIYSRVKSLTGGHPVLVLNRLTWNIPGLTIVKIRTSPSLIRLSKQNSGQPTMKRHPLANLMRRTGHLPPRGITSRQSNVRSSRWDATNSGGIRFNNGKQWDNRDQELRENIGSSEKNIIHELPIMTQPYQLFHATLVREPLHERR